MGQELIVLVTCPASHADGLARSLVEEKLAACVNIVRNVTSIYRWEGQVASDSEDLLVIKSNKQRWNELTKRAKELHTYDTPEIICFDIADGYKPYIDWLNSSLRQGD